MVLRFHKVLNMGQTEVLLDRLGLFKFAKIYGSTTPALTKA